MDASMVERLQRVLLQFVPFIMAVVFHEFAHGLAASRFGDTTARDEGRLTLNPVPHIDPIGTIVFPLISMMSGLSLLFGWAKPVPINPARFSSYRKGLFWVSFAGPGMNFFIALVSATIFWILRVTVSQEFYLYEPLINMLYISVSLNFALGIFNLLPLPPLDGSKMIESFLSYNAARKYEMLSQYSFYILIGLMITGAFAILHYPIRFLTEATFMITGALLNATGILNLLGGLTGGGA